MNEYGKIHTDGSRSGGQPLNDSIEEKALELLNVPDWPYEYEPDDHPVKVLCRAIEQHEAFKQEVSDALVDYFGEHLVAEDGGDTLASFIIRKPKPDPLVDVVARLGWDSDYVPVVRATLDFFDLEIREKGQ
jgi:hypothetical protein